jgi:hypothetical protein
MLAVPPSPPGDIPPGWEPVGPSGRFYQIALPMSDEAVRLNGDQRRYIFYAEFDTSHEGTAWEDFLFDPLKMLQNEDVTLPASGAHVGIRILKLEDDGQSPNEEYTEAVTARGERTMAIMAERKLDPVDRNYHVVTTVLNHEVALNPRIGTAF